MLAATTPSAPNGDTYSSPDLASETHGLRTVDDADEVDPKSFPFTPWDKFVLVLSMTTVIADVCTDAWVAHKHWQQGKRLYFGLTIAFIFVPSCVISLLSLRWWFIQQCPPGHEEFRMSTRLTVVLHVFLLAVVYRYLSALIFGFKSQDRSRNKADRCAYHLLMLWEGNDASLLRVVESALESVPQVLLQSYVLITAQEQEPSVVLAQVGSIGFGVGSAAWSLVAYVRTLRFSLEDSLNVSWLATVVCYCSHLMVLMPRLTALALFSSVFHWWTLLVCGIRWLVMYTWLIMRVRIKQYENRCDKFCFKVVLALIYISCFIDLAQKDRRYNGIFFYAFTFCENALLLGLWYCYNQSSPWYETLALVGSFLSFCVGTASLVIYYLLLHPNASSIAQSVMQDLNKWIDYVSKRSKDSPVELPNAEHGSSPCVHLTESVCNSDPLETSGDLAFENTGGANDSALPLYTMCDSHAIEYS